MRREKPPSVAQDTPRAIGGAGVDRADVPGRWTLEIPGWRPALDNELVYVHWRKALRLKKRDVEVLWRAALAFGVPKATGRRRVALTIRNRFGSFPDDTAPLKSLWDALRDTGLILDDSREWMEFVWPPTFERGEKMTVITLEDISDLPAPGPRPAGDGEG